MTMDFNATIEQARALLSGQKPDDIIALLQPLMNQDMPAEGLHVLGIAYLLKQQYHEAVTCYQNALKQAEHHAYYGNLAVALGGLKQDTEAERAYLHALGLNPNYLDARKNYGIFLLKARRHAEAEANLLQVWLFKPDDMEIQRYLLEAYYWQKKMDLAESIANKLLPKMPNDFLVNVTAGFCAFHKGNEKKGWQTYRNRHQAKHVPALPFPQWTGQDLSGKTILIYPEQGFGDQIQFIRYTRELKSAGATVWALIRPPLVSMFETVPWIDKVLKFEGSVEIPRCEYSLFSLDVAEHFGFMVGQSHTRPYMQAPHSYLPKWQSWLAEQCGSAKRKIGLVWGGNPDHGADWTRSLGLAQLAPLGLIPDTCFVSLQMGKQKDELNTPPKGMNIVDATAHIQDFGDSAALLQQLDLLITIDSSPAHLAGALGCPVWSLIPYMPDWRWGLEGEQTAWYPSMRLFRQPERDAWEPVIEKVAVELMGTSTIEINGRLLLKLAAEAQRQGHSMASVATDCLNQHLPDINH